MILYELLGLRRRLLCLCTTFFHLFTYQWTHAWVAFLSNCEQSCHKYWYAGISWCADNSSCPHDVLYLFMYLVFGGVCGRSQDRPSTMSLARIELGSSVLSANSLAPSHLTSPLINLHTNIHSNCTGLDSH